MKLTDQLIILESLGFIRVDSAVSEGNYLFRHALVQDAAYASLLKQDRRRLHRIVGEAMESEFAGRLDKLAPVLAEHFAIAGDESRAYQYFTSAGDNAARRYANAEAIMHYTRALDIARHLSIAPPAAVRDLYVRCGRAMELIGSYDKALRNYDQMEIDACGRGDEAMELAAVIAQATIRSTANSEADVAQARQLLARAQHLARKLGDRAAEARVLWNYLLVSVLDKNNPQIGIQYGEQALALARELGLDDQRAFILNDIWYVYARSGHWQRAGEALAEARGIWRSTKNPPMLAENLTRASLSHYAMGEYADAIRTSAEAVSVSRSGNNIDGEANGLGLAARAHFDLGRVDDAIRALEKAVELGGPLDNVTILAGTQADLGWVYGWLGMIDKGLALAQRARAASQALFPLLQPWSMAILARLHLLSGDLGQAESIMKDLDDYHQIRDSIGFIPFIWSDAAFAQAEIATARRDYAHAIQVIKDMLAIAADTGIRYLLPDAYYLVGRAQLEQGQMDEAVASLAQAHSIAEALDARRMLWPILSLLSNIEAQRGHNHEAGTLRQQARRTLLDIAGHTGSLEMRSSLMGLPAVKRLLSDATGNN